MALLKRVTDVLGGYEVGKGGGIIGGWEPLNTFRGWRIYGVAATYTDPDGFELPAFRLTKLSGPDTDTMSQILARESGMYVDRTWSYGNTNIRGSFPGLAWYLLDPTTMALVAGPLLPLGNAATRNLTQAQRDVTRLTEHYVQWYDHTTPIVGPYIGVQVAREPSEHFPLWISGHPVEIATDRLTAKGEAYDATSASAVQAALGPELQYILPVTSTDETPQEVLDIMSEAFGFAIRRSETNGSAEFVLWREKLASIAALPVLGDTEIREDGGPTFDLSETTRVNRVRVTAQVVQPWEPGTVTVREVVERGYAGVPTKIRWRSVADPLAASKPASGLVITSTDVTYDYSTDGVTPDADLYGEQEGEIELGGMPGMLNTVAGGATPVNLGQWAEGLARLLFDAHSRGRQMATAVGRRATDFDSALVGEAVTFDLSHLPNAQLGQSPTSQRGGTRPFRVIERTEEMPGPVIVCADEGTGVQYATVPVLTLTAAPDFATSGLLIVTISPANTFAADGVQIEFQVRIFADTATPSFADPGFRYTVMDTTAWTDEPHTVKLGPFPPQHTVYIRARAWQFGGSASDWSNWRSTGGEVTGPQTTLSDLRITNISNEGAQLDWSYDESPAVGQVKVQYRDVSGGFIGPYTTFSTLAAGTETETLTGLTAGSLYEVRIVLIDGALAEYGDVLLGTFAATGGKISNLVISSVTASEAKLAWTSTDTTHPVAVYYRVTGDPLWQIYQNIPASSTRLRLVGLTPSTGYDVMVALLEPFAPPLTGGFPIGDGAGGPALTGTLTTLAISVTLEYPLLGGAFEAWDPSTALRYDGRYGVRLHANPNNTMPHDIVVLLAVETSVGSATPGTYVEQTPIPATPGVDLWWVADAPNDGKLRYMKAISRATGYTDSIETIVVSADPWPDTGPTPPAGGGIPNTHTLTATAVAGGASVTGSFSIPDGAELFRVESTNGKEIRIRLYTDSTVLASDEPRASSNSIWPVGLLFDAEILAADSFLIDIPPPQRIRFILSLHENRAVWYRLTNLEAGAEDLSCRIYYFAGTTGGSGTLA